MLYGILIYTGELTSVANNVTMKPTIHISFSGLLINLAYGAASIEDIEGNCFAFGCWREHFMDPAATVRREQRRSLAAHGHITPHGLRSFETMDEVFRTWSYKKGSELYDTVPALSRAEHEKRKKEAVAEGREVHRMLVAVVQKAEARGAVLWMNPRQKGERPGEQFYNWLVTMGVPVGPGMARQALADWTGNYPELEDIQEKFKMEIIIAPWTLAPCRRYNRGAS